MNEAVIRVAGTPKCWLPIPAGPMKYVCCKVGVATAMLALTACQQERASARADSAAIQAVPRVRAASASNGATGVSSTAVSQAALDSARQSLRGFLYNSLQPKISSARERYVACMPDGQNNYSLALVGYRVLDATSMTADTILATAAVTSIAVETDSGPGGKRWNVYVGLRSDTMSWRMVRDSASRRWGICGYSTKGWGFGEWGEDENTTFDPPDMNWARIYTLSDSIIRALGDTL